MRFARPSVWIARLTGFSVPALLALGFIVPTARAQNNVINVWTVGSPFRGGAPPAIVPAVLQRQAQKLGYTIEVRAFEAEGFTGRFREAVREHAEPEVLTFDNYGVIWGLNTGTVQIEGLAADPQIISSLVSVNETMATLQTRGWVLLVSSAANYEAARSLALQPPVCDAPAAHSVQSTASDQLRQAEQTALAAAHAYLACDVASLKAVSDDSRLGDKCYLPGANVQLNAVEACSLSGNQGLAFVSLAGLFTAELRPFAPARVARAPTPRITLGRQSVVAILRNRDGAWRLLAISDDPLVTDGATRAKMERLNALLDPGQGDAAPVQPAQLEIADGALVRPAPGERFGDFAWSRDDSKDLVAQVVEFLVGEQYDPRERTRLFFLFNHENSLSAGYLWGIGGRWRVWSIDRQGNVILSEQRSYYTH